MSRSVALSLVVVGCGRGHFDTVPDALPDAAPDAPGPFLVCPTFEPAHAEPPAAPHQEPNLHPDGRRLIARQGPNEREASRASSAGPFGVFGPVTTFPTNIEDASFAIIDGQLVGFGAQGPAPRRLVICPAPSADSTCTPITVVDEATGQVITDDHDGPAPAVLDGQPVLAFSRGDDVYVARPTAATLETWTATRLTVATPTSNFDDPAITPDGEILLVLGEQTSPGIYAVRWDASLERYDEVLQLYAGVAGSPAVLDTGGTLEILFNLDTRGVLEAHHAFCTRTR